jgi:hypothetical protein
VFSESRIEQARKQVFGLDLSARPNDRQVEARHELIELRCCGHPDHPSDNLCALSQVSLCNCQFTGLNNLVSLGLSGPGLKAFKLITTVTAERLQRDESPLGRCEFD